MIILSDSRLLMNFPLNPLAFLAVVLSLVAVAFIATFSSCRDEVFEPDPDDPRLPRYTEKGNEIGGALINDTAWKTNFERYFTGAAEVFFIKNYADGDSVVVEMTGRMYEGLDSGALINLHFVLRDLEILKVRDVTTLRGQRFMLDGSSNYGVIEDYDERFNPGVQFYSGGVGEFYIKHVKELTNVTITGPDPYHPCIISGTFHFSTPHSTVPMHVASGRFDFSFGRSNLMLR